MDSCDSCGPTLTNEHTYDEADAYHPFCFQYAHNKVPALSIPIKVIIMKGE